MYSASGWDVSFHSVEYCHYLYEVCLRYFKLECVGSGDLNTWSLLYSYKKYIPLFSILFIYLFIYLLNFLNFFYYYSITVVCIFSPSLHPTPAKPTSFLHLHPPPWFCPCVLYSSSDKPLSSLSPPHSPLAIVTLFLTSMSLVIFCLLFFFCWLCSSKRWDHMVFVPHRLAYLFILLLDYAVFLCTEHWTGFPASIRWWQFWIGFSPS